MRERLGISVYPLSSLEMLQVEKNVIIRSQCMLWRTEWRRWMGGFACDSVSVRTLVVVANVAGPWSCYLSLHSAGWWERSWWWRCKYSFSVYVVTKWMEKVGERISQRLYVSVHTLVVVANAAGRKDCRYSFPMFAVKNWRKAGQWIWVRLCLCVYSGLCCKCCRSMEMLCVFARCWSRELRVRSLDVCDDKMQEGDWMYESVWGRLRDNADNMFVFANDAGWSLEIQVCSSNICCDGIDRGWQFWCANQSENDSVIMWTICSSVQMIQAGL